jgi:uncharacterized protein YjcR
VARARSPNRDKAYEIFKEHNGDITNRKIAELLGEDEKKVAVWKQRDKWNVVQQSESNVVQQKKIGPPKGNQNAKGHGAPRGNKNAVGNNGGAPKGNKNSEKHGLFSKHLPPETMELVDYLQQEDEITKLKRKIAIQEAAIIRSQSIMHVTDKEELIENLKKSKDTMYGEEKEWEFQYAWDRQGNFLNSLSRAMTTLMGMYKTLAELTKDIDSDGDVNDKVNSFVEALNGSAEEVWNDEEEE